MDLWQNYGLIFIAIAIVVFVINAARSHRRPSTVDAALAEEYARAEYDAKPRCITGCGEVALYPVPLLARSRGFFDWLRRYFAAPPRYKRELDMMLPPVLCTDHVHVADAELDKFIFRVRSEYASLNAKIATDAAGFSQEALLKAVTDSLTENQKRATRKAPATIRVLPARTGTDDAANDGN